MKRQKTAPGAVSPAWLRAYDREWLRGDVLAGVTTAAVVIPQALGYATIAGLPVELGLYTCIVPMLVYAFLGTSRALSFSTTSTIVAVTGTALVSVGVAGTETMVATTATLTLLVGLLLVTFRLLRIGWIVEAISEATVIGLKFGVALTVIVDQLLRIVNVENTSKRFLVDVGEFVLALPNVDAATAILTGATLTGLIILRRVAPKAPAALLAIVAGIVLVAWFGLADTGISLIDQVPLGLPVPELPSLAMAGPLFPAAFAIAVMAYVETLTAGRIARNVDDPPLDNNREFVANGLGAIAGSFVQALPPAGGLSQTQVNDQAGARTQLSGLVTSLLALAVALFIAPVLSDLPQATLAAVVIVAVSGLLDPGGFRRLWRIDRAEFVGAVATAVAALAFDLLAGVLVGVAATFYLVLRSLNHPVVTELRRDPVSGDLLPSRNHDPEVPGLLILRVEGGIYTMNVRRVQAEMLERLDGSENAIEVVILDASGTGDTSVTVLDLLLETDQLMARRGTDLWLTGLPERALEKARRARFYADWEARAKIYPSVSSAVNVYEIEKLQ